MISHIKTERVYNLISQSQNHDLIMCIGILLLFITSVILSINIIRVILSPVIIFIIGYLIICYLFPLKNNLNGIARLILSFNVGILVLSIIGILCAITVGLKLNNLLIAITIYITILTTAIWYYRKHSQNTNLYTLNLKNVIERVNIKIINIILTFILLSLIGIIIRVLPFMEYSIYIGTWYPGNNLYPIIYTIQTGTFLKWWDLPTPTFYSRMIFNNTHLLGFISFYASLFILAGITEVNQMLLFNKYLLWVGAVYIPLIAILWLNKAEEQYGVRLSVWHYILAYLLASFVSFKFIFITRVSIVFNIFAWMFMSLSIYLLTLKPTLSSRFLSIIFAFSISLFHNTAATVYLIMLMTVIALQSITRKKLVPMSYVLAYLVIYLVYKMNVASVLFYEHTRLLSILFRFEEVVVAKYTYTLSTLTLWHILLYVNTLLLLSSILIFIYIKFIKFRKKECDILSDIVLFMFIGLTPVAIAFLGWRGLKGMLGRTINYIDTIYIAIFSILLVWAIQKRNKKLRYITYILSTLIIVTSILSHICNDVYHPHFITYTEYEGLAWYIDNGPSDKIVFTDFRLGTVPVLFNYFNFGGFIGHSIKDLQEIPKVYYERNPEKAYEIISKFKTISITGQNYEHSVLYLLLSEEMIKKGVITTRDQLKGLTPEALSGYNSAEKFNKIYDNGKTWYYFLS